MTRILTHLFMIVSFASAVAGTPTLHQTGLSERDLIWRALLATLNDRGLAIITASQADGAIMTDFGWLDPKSLTKVAVLYEPDNALDWAGAEYRYQIDLQHRLVVRADIRAWQATNSPEATASAKRILLSNQRLEHAFLRDFAKALAALDRDMIGHE